MLYICALKHNYVANKPDNGIKRRVRESYKGGYGGHMERLDLRRKKSCD